MLPVYKNSIRTIIIYLNIIKIELYFMDEVEQVPVKKQV